MIWIRIVKPAKNEEDQKDNRDNPPHGIKVLKELVMPYANTYRIACADSYFASVPAAGEFWTHGLRFIGVIKTATRHFTME